MTDRNAPAGGVSLAKLSAIALGGASIEWYDFYVYGTAAALIFPRLFFPQTLSPIVAQLAAFSTFAVGFIARPVGGIVFGHLGDALGRKRALVIALLVMGAASTCIGLLPSYSVVGAAAPIALIVLRFAQGFAAGGQWGAAVLLVIENAPVNRRGFYGSFAQMGAPTGMVLANLAFLLMNALMSPAAFQSWGWRIPFLISIGLFIFAGYIHARLDETAAFRSAGDAQDVAWRQSPWRNSPILEALRTHPREVFLAGGAFLGPNGCFYVVVVYVIAYATDTLGMSRGVILSAVLFGNVVMVFASVLFAHLSDSWGQRRMFMVGIVATAIWAFAFFPLLDTKSVLAVFAAIGIALIPLSMTNGPMAALFANLFATPVRYSGISLAYQIGGIGGGGFAPIIATALVGGYGTTLPIAVYMAVLCAFSFVCTVLLGSRSIAARNAAAI